MSLMLTPPTDSHHGFRYSHALAISPKLSFAKRTASTVYNSTSTTMTSSHRGLPPPAAMTLPDPTRQPNSASHNFAHLPAPPAQWHDAEDSMREWLAAKMEDDKRKQEEAKVEQRRIEERMLRDAYSSPVPPHLIPVIFAGLSGGPLAAASLEMAQQHLAQIQQQAQAQHQQYMAQAHASPELRQNQQIVAQPVYLPAQPQQVAQAAPGQVLPSQSQHASVYPSPAYQSPKSRNNKTLYAAPPQYGPHSAGAARGPATVSLSRLTTNEPVSAAPSSYAQQQEQSSPNEPTINFHHWTPATLNSKDSAKPSPNIPSHVSGNDHSNSPRKRKAHGGHERNPPPPTSNPAAASPAFSATSSGSTKSHRTAHRRQDSRDSPRDPPREPQREPQRATYDPIGRNHRSGGQAEPNSRDNSGSDQSGPISRPDTPKDTPNTSLKHES